MAQVRNHLIFGDGTDSAVIEIASHAETQRNITDPVTKRQKIVHALELHLKSVDGVPTNVTYSVLGDQEYAMWSPWLVGNAYVGRVFRVTKTGSGFGRGTTIETVTS